MGDQYDAIIDRYSGAQDTAKSTGRDSYDEMIDRYSMAQGPTAKTNSITEDEFHQLPFLDKLKATFDGRSPYGNQKPIDPTFDNPLFVAVGKAGAYADRKVNDLAGVAAEKFGQPGAYAGTALGTAADFLLPQNKEAAGMAFLGGLKMPEAKSLQEGVDRTMVGSPQAFPQTNRTRVVQPNALENIIGGAISATSRVPQKFAAAVVADPSILGAETPELPQVSQKFNDYFAQKGVQIDAKKLAEISGKDYFPNENAVETLRKTLVKPVLDKLAAGEIPTEEELIFAERAAGAIKRSTSAQTNRNIMGYAESAQSSLIDALDKSGFSELPELKAQWFRALAKDAFQSFLPKNKVGSPNALSSLLMGKQFSDALGELASGNLPGAAGKAIQGIAFSPVLVGQGIRSLAPSVGQPMARLGMIAAPHYEKLGSSNAGGPAQ